MDPLYKQQLQNYLEQTKVTKKENEFIISQCEFLINNCQELIENYKQRIQLMKEQNLLYDESMEQTIDQLKDS